MLFNVTFKPSVSGISENNALMRAVYTRSLPHQPHFCRLSPPPTTPHFKSYLIGLVWSHASISIHLLWPWWNLMGVKEVFTLAVRTLIVCLADLVNWRRRKSSQSVPLIGSALHHAACTAKLFFLASCPGSPWVLCDIPIRSTKTFANFLLVYLCVYTRVYKCVVFVWGVKH